jgi:hypothetical protein
MRLKEQLQSATVGQAFQEWGLKKGENGNRRNGKKGLAYLFLLFRLFPLALFARC